MLCQNCNNNPATIHFKQIINGDMQELHLCSECSSKLGHNTQPMFGNPQLNFGLDSFLSNMLSQNKPTVGHPTTTCPLCGSHESDITRSGRVGCAQCYSVFDNLLGQYINRLHGNTSHVGRMPEGYEEKYKLRSKLDKLKQDMKNAVESQEYERAAEIRDEIRLLEGGGDSDRKDA